MPIHLDDSTLKLAGVSPSAMEATLKCLGLPTSAEILTNHPEVSDLLGSWAFYWGLFQVAKFEDTSLEQIGDGHVLSKINVRAKQAHIQKFNKESLKFLSMLKAGLGMDTTPKLLGIGVAPNTHYWRNKKSCCTVENTTSPIIP